MTRSFKYSMAERGDGQTGMKNKERSIATSNLLPVTVFCSAEQGSANYKLEYCHTIFIFVKTVVQLPTCPAVQLPYLERAKRGMGWSSLLTVRTVVCTAFHYCTWKRQRDEERGDRRTVRRDPALWCVMSARIMRESRTIHQ